MIEASAEALAMMFGLGLTGPLRGVLTISVVIALMSLLPGARSVAGVVAIGMSVLGWAAANVADGLSDVSDDGRIVVDEAAGVAVMMALAMPRAWRETLFLGIAFWMLDGLKPWPIRWIESGPGAWGIMGDDIAAGVLVAVVYLIVSSLYERVAKRQPKG